MNDLCLTTIARYLLITQGLSSDTLTCQQSLERFSLIFGYYQHLIKLCLLIRVMSLLYYYYTTCIMDILGYATWQDCPYHQDIHVAYT